MVAGTVSDLIVISGSSSLKDDRAYLHVFCGRFSSKVCIISLAII